MNTFEWRTNEYALYAGPTAFGRNVIIGKRFSPIVIFSALAIFLDNCGEVQHSVAVDVPESYHEFYSAMLNLPLQEIQLVGTALYSGMSVGLLSQFTKDGEYISSSGVGWEISVSFIAAAMSTGDGRVYAGYSGDGLNYYDIFVAMFKSSGELAWARTYSTSVRDEARAMAICSAGIVVVGVRGTSDHNGVILVLDNEGSAIQEHDIQGCDLNFVKAVSPGFVAIGATDSGSAIVIFGNNMGGIDKMFEIASVSPNSFLSASSIEERGNGNFILLMNYVDSTLSSEASIITAEIDMRTGTLAQARQLRNEDGGKSFGISLYASPQGGFNIAGYQKGKYETYRSFFGETVDGLKFMGHPYNIELPGNFLTLSDVTALRNNYPQGLTVKELQGYHSMLLNEVVTSGQQHLTKHTSYGQGRCFPVEVSPPPTALPTSSGPTLSPTFMPTLSPSIVPTNGPSKAGPTDYPTTNMPTGPNSTIAPSVNPSIRPSENPTHFPSVVPTAKPSNPPSLIPTFPPMISMPPTQDNMSITDAPSVSASEIRTYQPSKSPMSPAPTLIPSILENSGELQSSYFVNGVSNETFLHSLGYVCAFIILIGVVLTYRRVNKRFYFRFRRPDTSILKRSGAKPAAAKRDIESGGPAEELRPGSEVVALLHIHVKPSQIVPYQAPPPSGYIHECGGRSASTSFGSESDGGLKAYMQYQNYHANMEMSDIKRSSRVNSFESPGSNAHYSSNAKKVPSPESSQPLPQLDEIPTERAAWDISSQSDISTSQVDGDDDKSMLSDSSSDLSDMDLILGRK